MLHVWSMRLINGYIVTSVKFLISLYCCRDSNIICEQIYSTGKDLGIDVVDEKQHDVKSSKETITCLLAENRLVPNFIDTT